MWSHLPKRKLRVLPFVPRDKFEHRRLSTIHRGQAACEGRDDVLRIGDAFTIRAQGLGNLRALAREPFHVILLQAFQ
jgi:hypothetical protein